MDDLRGNPAGLATQQIEPLDPGDRRVRVERPRSGTERGRIDNGFARRQLAAAGAPARPDLLGVEPLAGFHQGRCHCLRQLQPLALRDRNRARIRPHRDRDRDADAVEPSDVAEPGNPHPRHVQANPRQRLGGIEGSMGPLPKCLRQALIEQMRER